MPTDRRPCVIRVDPGASPVRRAIAWRLNSSLGRSVHHPAIHWLKIAPSTRVTGPRGEIVPVQPGEPTMKNTDSWRKGMVRAILLAFCFCGYYAVSQEAPPSPARPWHSAAEPALQGEGKFIRPPDFS